MGFGIRTALQCPVVYLGRPTIQDWFPCILVIPAESGSPPLNMKVVGAQIIPKFPQNNRGLTRGVRGFSTCVPVFFHCEVR